MDGFESLDRHCIRWDPAGIIAQHPTSMFRCLRGLPPAWPSPHRLDGLGTGISDGGDDGARPSAR